ncbi:MAG: hypothetical protein E7311_04750 [Clostridiales bacterium]|nr:hypothetical protein [Clostridiales bacterium]
MQSNKAKLMKTDEIVQNMDILYHVVRTDEKEKEEAISNMKELINLIAESNLEQVYFSPTELIINAVICYKDQTDSITSEVDKKICELVCKLGYMKNAKTQI